VSYGLGTYRQSILRSGCPKRIRLFWFRYLFRRLIAKYRLLLQVLTVLDCLSLHPRVTIQQKPSDRDPNVPPFSQLRPIIFTLSQSERESKRSPSISHSLRQMAPLPQERRLDGRENIPEISHRPSPKRGDPTRTTSRKGYLEKRAN
jgi:hypothetical protein